MKLTYRLQMSEAEKNVGLLSKYIKVFVVGVGSGRGI